MNNSALIACLISAVVPRSVQHKKQGPKSNDDQCMSVDTLAEGLVRGCFFNRDVKNKV